MPLDQAGVILKIYDGDGKLLIARPCKNEDDATAFFNQYRSDHLGVWMKTTPRLPRI